jgi:hypothetical protein
MSRAPTSRNEIAELRFWLGRKAWSDLRRWRRDVVLMMLIGAFGFGCGGAPDGVGASLPVPAAPEASAADAPPAMPATDAGASAAHDAAPTCTPDPAPCTDIACGSVDDGCGHTVQCASTCVTAISLYFPPGQGIGQYTGAQQCSSDYYPPIPASFCDADAGTVPPHYGVLRSVYNKDDLHDVTQCYPIPNLCVPCTHWCGDGEQIPVYCCGW